MEQREVLTVHALSVLSCNEMRNPHSLSMQFAALVQKEVNQLYSKDSQLVLNAKQLL